VVLVDGRSGLGVDDLAGAGLGFLGGDGFAWVFISGMGIRGLVLLFLEPLSGVDFCLDGRGRGAGCGWGRAAGNQSFDGYDQRNGLDLAGDGASGYFVAEIGELPEPGQDLVANKVLIGNCIFGHGESVPRLLKIGGAELSGFVCYRLVTHKGLREAWATLDWYWFNFGQGSGALQDSGEAYPSLTFSPHTGRESRLELLPREKLRPDDIVCLLVAISGFSFKSEARFSAREYSPRGYSR
jgi:hypothetical protein